MNAASHSAYSNTTRLLKAPALNKRTPFSGDVMHNSMNTTGYNTWLNLLRPSANVHIHLGEAEPGTLHMLPPATMAYFDLNVPMALMVLRIDGDRAVVCPVVMNKTGSIDPCNHDRYFNAEMHDDQTIDPKHVVLQMRTKWACFIQLSALGTSQWIIRIEKLFANIISHKEFSQHQPNRRKESFPHSMVLSKHKWHKMLEYISAGIAWPEYHPLANTDTEIGRPAAKRTEPFRLQDRNQPPSVTGCMVSGKNGMICACRRMCLGCGKRRFYVCGVESVKRRFSNQGDATSFVGVDGSGTAYNLGERWNADDSIQIDRHTNEVRLR